MVHGQRQGPACRHVEKDPLPVRVAQGAGQERIRRDEPAGQVEAADVVAFEVEPGLVALDVDLDLEGRDQREPPLLEGA